jgi:hypothetical protein
MRMIREADFKSNCGSQGSEAGGRESEARKMEQ